MVLLQALDDAHYAQQSVRETPVAHSSATSRRRDSIIHSFHTFAYYEFTIFINLISLIDSRDTDSATVSYTHNNSEGLRLTFLILFLFFSPFRPASSAVTSLFRPIHPLLMFASVS